MIKVYHNPRCKKSRAGLQYVQEHTNDFEIIEYLKNPIDESTFKTLLMKLNLKPLENCEELTELYLFSDHPEENEFTKLDVSALFNCTELEDFGVSEETTLQADKNLQDEDDLPLAIEELLEDNRIEWV